MGEGSNLGRRKWQEELIEGGENGGGANRESRKWGRS
jgi:hypothetical protein